MSYSYSVHPKKNTPFHSPQAFLHLYPVMNSVKSSSARSQQGQRGTSVLAWDDVDHGGTPKSSKSRPFLWF